MQIKNEHSIISLFKPYIFRLLLVFFFNFLSVVFSILSFMLIEPILKILFGGSLTQLSFLGRFFIDFISKFVDIQSFSQSMAAIVCLVVILFLFKNLFYFLSQWFMAPVRSNLICYLRNKMYDKILILPLAYFGGQKKGDVVSRAVNDAQEIDFTILKSVQQFLTEPISIIIYLVALFAISYQLTFCVLLLLPLAGLVISKISRSLRGKSKLLKDQLGSLFSTVEETISGLKIIKGFNAQHHIESYFDKKNDQFSVLQKRIYRQVDLASPISEFLGVTVIMVILVFGGYMVLKPGFTLSAELFITYIALISQIINPVKNFSAAFSNYRRGVSAIDRINELLFAEEVILQSPNAQPVSSFNNRIDIKDLSFAYAQDNVLNHITMSINKGQLIALVGPSGSGKSTLADLLVRFYEPQQGEILLDGININQYVIDDLRSLFGLVSQDVVLFNDTIRGNITFGLTDVSDEMVVKATKMANIYDFIRSLPDGFETNIGDRGLCLSGGQRQRLSIARTILRNTPILILDEATSAMDTESEKLVQHALDNVMEGHTSLVIAHRLSTIQHADCIYVMENGYIVESGTHEELMQHNGKYRKLVEIQNI